MSGVASTYDAAAAAWRAVLSPPAPRSYGDFASALVIGDGPKAGTKWSLDAPAHRAIVAALDAHARQLFVVGPVQDGKTYTAVVLPVLYHILEDRRSVLLAGPRFEDCAAIYSAKIRGTLIASGFSDALPDAGRGSRTGVPDEVLFATGARLYMRGMGGANEAQQAAVTVRAVVVTEADSVALSTRYSKRDMEQEGRRKLALIRRRCDSYVPGELFVVESTVKADENSLILALWADGTRHELHHPCPRCGGWTRVSWAEVRWEPGDASTARWECPLCHREVPHWEFQEAARHALPVAAGQRVVGSGVVEGDAPQGAPWSLRWSALDAVSVAKSLPNLVAEYEAAVLALRQRGDVSQLRQFVRDQLATSFDASVWLESLDVAVPVARVPRPEKLAARSATGMHARGELPADAGPAIALAIDVQEREVWWLLMCSRGAEGAAIVDWGVEYVCHRHEAPTAAQRADALDRCYSRLAPYVEARRYAVVAGVDVGGRGWLDQVDAWLAAKKWRVLAVRGVGEDTSAHVSRVGRARFSLPGVGELYTRDDGRRLWAVDAAVKARVLEAVQLAAAAPQSIWVPRGVAADDALFRHLSAEEQREENGKLVWVKKSKNDLLDCCCYAWALLRLALELSARRASRTASAVEIDV